MADTEACLGGRLRADPDGQPLAGRLGKSKLVGEVVTHEDDVIAVRMRLQTVQRFELGERAGRQQVEHHPSAQQLGWRLQLAEHGLQQAVGFQRADTVAVMDRQRRPFVLKLDTLQTRTACEAFLDLSLPHGAHPCAAGYRPGVTGQPFVAVIPHLQTHAAGQPGLQAGARATGKHRYRCHAAERVQRLPGGNGHLGILRVVDNGCQGAVEIESHQGVGQTPAHEDGQIAARQDEVHGHFQARLMGRIFAPSEGGVGARVRRHGAKTLAPVPRLATSSMRSCTRTRWRASAASSSMEPAQR